MNQNQFAAGIRRSLCADQKLNAGLGLIENIGYRPAAFAVRARPEITGNGCQMGIFEERVEGPQTSLSPLGEGGLALARGVAVVFRTVRIERHRYPPEAATALIITVDRHHHLTVKHAAPQVSEPSENRSVARIGGLLSWIHIRHM